VEKSAVARLPVGVRFRAKIILVLPEPFPEVDVTRTKLRRSGIDVGVGEPRDAPGVIREERVRPVDDSPDEKVDPLSVGCGEGSQQLPAELLNAVLRALDDALDRPEDVADDRSGRVLQFHLDDRAQRLVNVLEGCELPQHGAHGVRVHAVVDLERGLVALPDVRAEAASEQRMNESVG